MLFRLIKNYKDATVINWNLDEIDQLSLYVNNKIVNLKEHAKLYLVQKKISKIRNAVSPQPRARVFLHFGLNKQQQEQLIYNLQKNQISNGIWKENELTFIDNINERIHKLDNIRPLKVSIIHVFWYWNWKYERNYL